MARLQIRTDANAVLASVDIPDTAIPRLKAAFGGGTNAEVAAAVLAFASPVIRAEMKKRLLELKWAADYAIVPANQATEAAAIDTDWP